MCDLGEGHQLLEMPLIVMDTVLRTVHREAPIAAFERLVAHIARIGGAISLLTHTGTMANPELPEARGLYENLLRAAAQLGAHGVPATQFIADPGSGL